MENVKLYKGDCLEVMKDIHVAKERIENTYNNIKNIQENSN